LTNLLSERPDLTAHRKLVEAVLAQEWEAPLPSGEMPVDVDTHDLWKAAERSQRKIGGDFEVEAMDAVNLLVQHVMMLASRARWFLSDAELRALAIEETIIYSALGWTVSSQKAQLAFASMMGGGLAPRTGGSLESTWSSAWEQWTAEQ
jgi:hypothetical protein